MPPVIGFDADVLGRRRTGDETATAETLAALGRLDLPFRILAYLRDPAALPPDASARGVVVPVPVRVPSNYLRGALALPARLQADRPAAYHGLYLLPPALPCPGIVTVADCSFLRSPEYMPRLDRAAFARFVPWSARRAARIVCGADYTRQDLLELVPGLDPDRIAVIPWGVSPRFAPVEGAGELVADRWSLDRPYVLFVGALQPRKNLRRLLEAWAMVRARRPADEILVLAGEVRHGARELDALIERLGIAGSVRRLGYVESDEDLRVLLSAARALAFPTLYEGVGLPVWEAMACGTPVLTSATTALPETAGGAALLVDPLAPGAIAEGLERLLADDAEHDRLRAAGLRRVADVSWDRTAQRLAALYEGVIAEGARARSRRPSGERATSREPLVTASVVSTGEADRLAPCIDALEAQGLGDDLAVVVVCNAPGDGSVELVRSAFPRAHVVEQPERRGFAENHNRGLAAVPARYGLVLNPDVVLEPGCLPALVEVLEADGRCGLVAPALVYPDGRPQPSARRFPEPLGTIARRTPLRALVSPQRLNRRHFLPPPADVRAVDWALGACLLVRRAAWEEVGGFDEGFRPLYVEDIDLAWRLQQAGWGVRQTPLARARHEHQAATDATFLTRRTLWHLGGMARFARKHPAMLAGYRPGLAVAAASR